ncbi:hypothetical protein [Bergeyella porcorum]
MKKNITLIFYMYLYLFFAQEKIPYESYTYKAETSYIKMGKYNYLKTYEAFFQPETKECGFSEILVKGNRKQFLGHFVYQLESSAEMQISPDNPPPIQIQNRILQHSSSEFDYKNQQIIVTTFFYDENNLKEKEVKTLQQSKKGFFFLTKKLFILRMEK